MLLPGPDFRTLGKTATFIWFLTDFTSSPPTILLTRWGFRHWRSYAPTMGLGVLLLLPSDAWIALNFANFRTLGETSTHPPVFRSFG